ncbi:hypothetical protein [Bulleidia extructa]
MDYETPIFENDSIPGNTTQAVFVVPAVAWIAAAVHVVVVVVGTVAVVAAAGGLIALGAAVYIKGPK